MLCPGEKKGVEGEAVHNNGKGRGYLKKPNITLSHYTIENKRPFSLAHML